MVPAWLKCSMAHVTTCVMTYLMAPQCSARVPPLLPTALHAPWPTALLWLPSLPRTSTDRTSCWSARRPRRPQGQAAARGGGSLRINEKGTQLHCVRNMACCVHNLAHCSLAKRALAPCKHPVGQASRHPPEACGRTVHPVPRLHQMGSHLKGSKTKISDAPAGPPTSRYVRVGNIYIFER